MVGHANAVVVAVDESVSNIKGFVIESVRCILIAVNVGVFHVGSPPDQVAVSVAGRLTASLQAEIYALSLSNRPVREGIGGGSSLGNHLAPYL